MGTPFSSSGEIAGLYYKKTSKKSLDAGGENIFI